MGRGLGWIDVHLLAAAMLAKLPFWTIDKRLSTVATEFGLQLRN
jgi:predicted nucleic acid-binding protein